jgi:hypothetical protein
MLVVLLAGFAGTADAASPFRRRESEGPEPSAGRGGKYFPNTGDVEDLVRVGKVLTYKNENFQALYGAAGNRYIQYGMINMMSSDYTYGGDDKRVSLEIATMETPTAAAGLFHHHRGTVLRNSGEAIDVGAEGVLDVPRGRRNLYFYRGSYFVKLVYSGKEPVPSLLPIAEYVDSRLPGGNDEKPAGFEYIDIEGVAKNTIGLTPGFTFNISFMPPSVWASAPDGGSPASDLHVITRYLHREAEELYRDYTSYLKLHAEYVEEYERDGLSLTKAVDPNQGRVLFTSYKNVVIIAARPDGYEKGEELIDRVIAKIDQVDGENKDKKDAEDKKKRRGSRWNPFRRRARTAAE